MNPAPNSRSAPPAQRNVVDEFQARVNRLLGRVMLAGIALVGLVGFADIFDDTPLGPPLAYTGAALLMGAGAAAIVLPLVVFLVALTRGPRHQISRAVRNAARTQGLVLGVLGLGLGATAEPLVWGLLPAIFGIAAIVVAVLAIREHAAPRTPKPSFGATAFATGAGVLFLLLFASYFGNTRDRAYLSAMRSDLKNYQFAQDIHRDSAGAFSADPTFGGTFESTRGVSLTRTRLTADGWIAETRHEAMEARCVMFVGSEAAAPATTAGVVECDAPGMVGGPTRWAGYASVALLLAAAVVGLLANGAFARR